MAVVRLLAVAVGFLALVFLFVGLLCTEWPQALIGVALAIATLLVLGRWEPNRIAVAESVTALP
jgi:hypothetical protein